MVKENDHTVDGPVLQNTATYTIQKFFFFLSTINFESQFNLNYIKLTVESCATLKLYKLF